MGGMKMEVNQDLLKNPWDVIDEIADDETQEKFELDDILVEISLKIINYRIEKGITQKKLAEKLNVSQSMISKLESGEYNPTIEQLWKVSKKLGWTLELQMKKPVETDIWNQLDTEIDFGNEEPSDEEMMNQIAEGA